jgi:predicted component of type VI protein secretion system
MTRTQELERLLQETKTLIDKYLEDTDVVSQLTVRKAHLEEVLSEQTAEELNSSVVMDGYIAEVDRELSDYFQALVISGRK